MRSLRGNYFTTDYYLFAYLAFRPVIFFLKSVNCKTLVAYLLRWDAFDVKVRKLNVYLLALFAVEEIMALRVARVQTGKVGRCESAVRSRLAFEHEAAH